MSEAGESSGDEIRRSPEDVVRISADALAEHAANTVDVITESLVATELMETGSASKSPIQSEPGAQTSTGISDEGSAEFRSENVFGIEGSAGHSEGASEHTGERIIGVEDGTGSGYRAGIKAGLESTASPGYVATGYEPPQTVCFCITHSAGNHILPLKILSKVPTSIRKSSYHYRSYYHDQICGNSQHS